MLLSRYSIIATARGASIASTSSPDVSGSATKQPTSKLGLYMTTATDLINDTSAALNTTTTQDVSLLDQTTSENLTTPDIGSTVSSPNSTTTIIDEITTFPPELSTPEESFNLSATTVVPSEETSGGTSATTVGVVMGLIVVVLLIVIAVLVVRQRRAADYNQL
ncbi:hypothetical protein LSH36_159g00012 [Paralvinella palmiformis]|uniref:Uncharacterized protein n=1 Tax=Paralvinella palmiformis TaxID=53620 RepID=A0AAD9JUB4_9ANNE|nr:hypothetical protein LSH36_159g00012 [Paralvinella palmiformis]